MIRTNNDRAKSAFDRVHGYGDSTVFSTLEPADFNNDDRDALHQQMGDLLCDLHHLADLALLQWDELLDRGDYHYQAEIQDAKEGLA